MQSALDSFHANIQRVRHLGGLYGALTKMTTQAIDASDLLRAQIVMAASALDFFIHEITIFGMLEIVKGNREPTSQFKKYKVSGHLIINNPAILLQSFEEDIRERHSYLSFQQPDKIADAVRLFSTKSLWKEVSLRMGTAESALKDELTLIIERRNKIAHEADADPSFPGARWPISQSDCNRVINFIEKICISIHEEVK